MSSPRGKLSHVRFWFEGDDVVLRGRVTGRLLSREHVKGHVVINSVTSDKFQLDSEINNALRHILLKDATFDVGGERS